MNGKKILAAVLAIAMLVGTAVTLVTALRNDDSSTGFDYSAAFDKNGYYKGVKATDYITLPDYKAFELPKSVTETTDEAIQAQLDAFVLDSTTQEQDFDAERVSVNGDDVNIDYVGYIDGVEFSGGSTGGNGREITIGSGALLSATDECKGFEEQLIGHKIGDKFEITVQFPEDYRDESSLADGDIALNGKIATFDITFNSFYKTIVPELTDELVATNTEGTYNTVEELRTAIEKNIIENQEYNYIWELLDAYEISEYPDKVVQFQKDAIVANLNNQASSYGMTAEDYVKLYGFDSTDAYLEEIDEDLKKTVAELLVIQAVCEEEGIKITKDDVKEYFLENYNVDDYSEYEAFYGTNYLKNRVLETKMMESIRNNATVLEK